MEMAALPILTRVMRRIIVVNAGEIQWFMMGALKQYLPRISNGWLIDLDFSWEYHQAEMVINNHYHHLSQFITLTEWYPPVS